MKKFDLNKNMRKEKSQYESIIALLKESNQYYVENFEGFKIIGSKAFIDLYKQVIILLQSKDNTNYNRVSLFIKEITMLTFIKSGFAFPSIYAYVQHLDDALSESIEWLTSCLVHEMVHCIIFDKLTSKGYRIEKFKEEQACLRVQVRSAKRLGIFIPDEQEYIDKIMSTRWFTFWGKIKRLFGK